MKLTAVVKEPYQIFVQLKIIRIGGLDCEIESPKKRILCIKFIEERRVKYKKFKSL